MSLFKISAILFIINIIVLLTSTTTTEAALPSALSHLSPRFAQTKVVNEGDLWAIFEFLHFFSPAGVDDNVLIASAAQAVTDRRLEITGDNTYRGKIAGFGSKAADPLAWADKKRTEITGKTMFDAAKRVASTLTINGMTVNADERMNLQNLVDNIAVEIPHSDANRNAACKTVVIGAGPVGLAAAILASGVDCKTTIMEARGTYTRRQFLAIQENAQQFMQLIMGIDPNNKDNTAGITKNSIMIKSVERSMYIYAKIAGIDFGNNAVFHTICARPTTDSEALGFQGLTRIPDTYADPTSIASQALCTSSNGQPTQFRSFKVIVGSEGVHSRVRKVLGFGFDNIPTIPFEDTPQNKKVKFDINIAERSRFGVLTFIMKIKSASFCPAGSTPVFFLVGHVGDFYRRSVKDYEVAATECWFEIFMRDDYAKKFLFTHREFLKLAGADEDTVWDNARDSLAFNYKTAKTAVQGTLSLGDFNNLKQQRRDFFAGTDYSIFNLLMLASVTAEKNILTPLKDTCDLAHAADDNGKKDCLADSLRDNIFTTDDLGGVALWYMKMRRMDAADVIGKKDNYYYSFEGDAIRDSYFPFGAGLDKSIATVIPLAGVLEAIKTNTGVDKAINTKRTATDASVTALISAASLCIAASKTPVVGLSCNPRYNDLHLQELGPTGNPRLVNDDAAKIELYVESIEDHLNGDKICSICEDMVQDYTFKSKKPRSSYCKDFSTGDKKTVKYRVCRAVKDTIIAEFGEKKAPIQAKVASATYTGKDAAGVCGVLFSQCGRDLTVNWVKP